MNALMDILEVARERLRKTTIEDYKRWEDIADELLSEMESEYEISIIDASRINELCEEWFTYEQ